MNSSCDLTVGSGFLYGGLVLVDHIPFFAWVGWPWINSTDTGKYFKVLA